MCIEDKLVALVRDTSSSIPADIEKALKTALRKETGPAKTVLETIVDNCKLARKNASPICQDTGTLVFYVSESLRRIVTPAVVKRAVAKATALGSLRKNCIDSVTGKSYDDNVCDGAPVVHYVDEVKSVECKLKSGGTVTLLLKGGGSENMSRQYSLPDAELGAGRDLAGVRKCILDAVVRAQGFGCAPGILGVCIGGDRATAYEVAKEQLLRPLGDVADGELGKLERKILKEANTLGIGPMGLGGKTTLLGVKITSQPRVPASFFVTVAYMCWACRRRTIAL